MSGEARTPESGVNSSKLVLQFVVCAKYLRNEVPNCATVLLSRGTKRI